MVDRIVHDLPIDSITMRPQVRTSSGLDQEELAGLAQSIIEAGGILQPILARREGELIVVIDGHRRLLAARNVGLKTVPVIIEENNLGESDVTYRQLVLDAQRVQLNPIERGLAIQRLMQETRWTAAKIAVKLGMSPGNVSKLLALLDLPADAQSDVAAGKLAMSAAYGLARVDDESTRGALLAEASDGKLSRDALSRKIKRIRRGIAAGSAPSRITVALGGGRMLTLSGRGLSIASLVDWMEQLLVKARKARSQGLELGTFAKMLRDQSKGAKGGAPC